MCMITYIVPYMEWHLWARGSVMAINGYYIVERSVLAIVRVQPIVNCSPVRSTDRCMEL